MSRALKAVIEEIAFLRGGQRPLNLMINKLAPGVHVPPHRDWLRPTQYQAESPTVERWHLPIQTAPGALFWHEGHKTEYFEPGVWVGPIPYWLMHSVVNDSPIERIHIVVDLDTPVRIGRYAEDK